MVMDNLAVHKVKGVEEAIHAAGSELLSPPPYSPDLNPIEMAWSKTKVCCGPTHSPPSVAL